MGLSPPSWLVRALAVVSSLGLSATLFGLLMLLTYLGTLYQVDHGLYAAQRKYFEAFLVFHELGRFTVPLPGAQLLLMILFVNLLAGGVLRMRKGWGQAGILLAHFGMLLLLVGGFISHRYALNGHVTLYEHEYAEVFKSHHAWEIAISRDLGGGTRAEFLIPESDFVGLQGGRIREFRSGALPFTLQLSNYLPNATPRRVGPGPAGRGTVVDGFALHALPAEPSPERNIAGIHAAVLGDPNTPRQPLLLWGLQQHPARVEMDGAEWMLDLRRQQWPLPFRIVLDTFTRELHPRTNMPSTFMSEVSKVENGVAEKARITMNQPLRHGGYTLYQASWGPTDAAPGTPLFGTLAVARNPAERFPMLACIVTTLGMLLHFTLKLRKYLARERKRGACAG